ncbi:MAG: hypothetical protein B6242_00950 [Anaerolineaceae bacterium 4572_78]|nr:MAG: hypothetical protein B6242_00950 [Anaerolineaceae bacterium 4572_78]
MQPNECISDLEEINKKQREEIAELRRLNRLKSEFLASISHDLRTPLNAIIGFADIMLQGIDGPLTEQALTDAEAILKSGQHLLRMLNDVLDMAKIESGRLNVTCSALDVPTAFDDINRAIYPLLQENPIDVLMNINANLPKIWADPLHFKQIMVNLIGNAIRFTKEGCVIVGAELGTNEMIHFYVQDTGIGISKEKQESIFDHYSQVGERRQRSHYGTGMGLSIAKKLVEMHKGKIWLESVVGEGSTFYVALPLTKDNM